jgi:hypothetical protein
MTFPPLAAGLAAFAFLAVAPSVASADETEFLQRFQGEWIGSGTVQREGASQPREVDCAIRGDRAENRVSVQGSCRAAVIFSRAIGADLTVDASGLYRGAYTGSRIGPAQLSGRRRGDVIDLRIDWPRPVNGDREARLTIRNDGRGALRITVADNLTPGGPVQRTSEIVLRRR